MRFEDRCQSDPQGVIKDLLAQTTRQAKAIHTLSTDLEKKNTEINELKVQLGIDPSVPPPPPPEKKKRSKKTTEGTTES